MSGMNIYNVTGIYFSGLAINSRIPSTFWITNTKAITAKIPEEAYYGKITILIPTRDLTGYSPFEFVPIPIINKILPSSGISGDTILISGKKFQNITRVTFNNIEAASYLTPSTSGISAVVPTGNTSGYIKIYGNSGVSALSNQYFYPQVKITNIDPSTSRTNFPIRITGSNFTSGLMYNLGNNDFQVSFNGSITGLKMVSSTLLTGYIPLLATTGPIQIFKTDGSSTYGSDIIFTKLFDPPVITKVTYGNINYSGQNLNLILFGTGFSLIRSGILTGILTQSGAGSGQRNDNYSININSGFITTSVDGSILKINNFPTQNVIRTGLYSLIITGVQGSGIIQTGLIVLSPTNLTKFGASASQSSYISGNSIYNAYRAIDGRSDVSINNIVATSITSGGTRQYWEVDLKQNYIINYVKIYNIRGSGIVGTNYETGLTNFCVDVKDSGNISRNSGNAFVFNKYYPGSGIFPNPYVTGMPNNITGRYIRIQTSGVGYLALAEVEVF